MLSALSLSAGEPDPKDPYLRDPDSLAKTPDEMKPYTQHIRDTKLSFKLAPIPGGEYQMGSPDSEASRAEDEGPVHAVKIEPFWMATHETTWELYDTWRLSLDVQRRDIAKRPADDVDKAADAITKPTKEYTDMTFGMGHDGFPAISMTQLAAKKYCEWLTARTGHYSRLPTEAEWEYACRAGTKTAYHFGDDPMLLDEYAWHEGNSKRTYQKVGLKKPSPWGLYDMHGNVREWCLDKYDPAAYSAVKPGDPFPVVIPNEEYPRVARGGSWDDAPAGLRSATRYASDQDWKASDPQLPQSIWWLTDAQFLGFRVIRPLRRPSEEEIKKYKLYADIPPEYGIEE